MKKKFWIPMLIQLAIALLIFDRNFSMIHRNRWELYTYPHIVSLISSLIFFPMVDITYWYEFRKYSFLKGIFAALLMVIIYTLLLIPFNNMLPGQRFSVDFSTLSYRFLLPIIIYPLGYILIYSAIRLQIVTLLRTKEIALQKSESELNTLKAQLNPHFFFNSLNYLYGTALAEKAERTSKAVISLSNMMRYTISGATETLVPLIDELNFINNYIHLQKARLPQRDSMLIKIDIVDYHGQKKIAPMLLLPFIENAFKYGVSIDDACSIMINIVVTGNELKMKVTNTIKESGESAGNNTGIINTRKRLELLYKNRYSLECNKTEFEYVVLLAVDIR